MSSRKTENHDMTTSDIKMLWMEEINRETEHYYQGEIQQDQRASWLLATDVALIAIGGSLIITVLDKGYSVLVTLIILSICAFIVSAICSIITLLPLQGIRFWRDLIGHSFQKSSKLKIDQLIEERFRCGSNWSVENYEHRVKYHFRSHYLRFIRKAYGIQWAALALFIGLIFFLIGVIVYTGK